LTDAEIFAELLNSKVSQKLLQSITFGDAKRLYTWDMLNRLDVIKLLADNRQMIKNVGDFLVKFDGVKQEQLRLAI